MLLLGENLCNALLPGTQDIVHLKIYAMHLYLVPSTQYTCKFMQCASTWFTLHSTPGNVCSALVQNEPQ